MATAYDFTVKKADGTPHDLRDFKGQVALIVNVASQCGFTPQYEGLQKLYDQYRGKGFTVLGFPCNQFGGQEPGSDQAIQEFCETRFAVKFPVFAKIEVNGAGADPLYQFLKGEAPGVLGTELIKWNFTKFLVGREGQVLNRYAPNTEPKALAADIESALKSV